jgi:hypothetical protein
VNARSLPSLLAVLVVLLALPAHGQAPGETISAYAPIVGGNAASAKQRALDDAFRQAVERSFAALAAEGGPLPNPLPPGLAQLRGTFFARAKRYVRSYRVLGQGEDAGRYRVDVSAEVDEGLLRRDIERARAASAPATTPGRLVAGPTVLLTGTPPEAVTALARAAGAVGLKAETPPLPGVDETRAREVASRAGAAAVAMVTGNVTPEGPVRGTGKVAASCRVAVRVIPAGGGAASDRAVEERDYADNDDGARAECLSRAAADLAPQLVAALNVGSPAPGMRLVTLDVDLVEPAALPLVLQALRKTGNGAEVRRVTVGHVELRATTRLAGPALVASLTRELAPAATVTPGESLSDRVALQVRLAAAASPEAPPPPPAQ